jgi:hypothetical protein
MPGACLDTRPVFFPGVHEVIRKFTIAIVSALLLAAQAQAAEDTYPRVGGVLIGNPQNYWDAAYQAQIATLNVAVLAAYPGWGSSKGTTTGAAVKSIKAKNPNTRIFLYVIGESLRSPADVAWLDLGRKIDQQGWWLYQGGSTKVLSDFGQSMFVLNITPFARKDANGQSFNQWFAGYVGDAIAKPAPDIDGLFTDNVFWKPRRDGDWNGDGKIDSQNDPTVQKWYRQGYAQYIDALRARMPGKLQLANVADWGQTNSVLSEYQGKWNGGVLEGVIGKSYSIESYGGWAAMMASYRKTMAALAAPKLGLFQIDGKAGDYRTMRYGLASCLMDDGYFAYNQGSGYSGVFRFDEYDAKLGKAVSKPATAAWQQGVYRRDFENGIALVNPKGNGAKDVTLEADFVAIKGTQDPAVNSGKTLRKVHLEDRDGVILLRKAPVRRPAAPPAVTIEAAG